MASFVLRSRPHVDHGHFAATEAPGELVASDGLQAVTPSEVRLRESVDFRHMLAGDLAHHRPELQDLLARQPIEDARPVATSPHETRPGQVAQMMGGVGDALADLRRHVLDRPFPLRQQVDDLRPPPARQRLAHRSQRLEERFLGRPRTHESNVRLACRLVKQSFEH